MQIRDFEESLKQASAAAAPLSVASVNVFSGLGPGDLGAALKSADAFLDVILFLTMFGVSLAAASLLMSAAALKRKEAEELTPSVKDRHEKKTTSDRDDNKAGEAYSSSVALNAGARFFMQSTFPLFIGLVSTFAFDVFDQNGAISAETGSALASTIENFSQILKGEFPHLLDDVGEVVVGFGALGIALMLMLRGQLAASQAFIKQT